MVRDSGPRTDGHVSNGWERAVAWLAITPDPLGFYLILHHLKSHGHGCWFLTPCNVVGPNGHRASFHYTHLSMPLTAPFRNYVKITHSWVRTCPRFARRLRNTSAPRLWSNACLVRKDALMQTRSQKVRWMTFPDRFEMLSTDPDTASK